MGSEKSQIIETKKTETKQINYNLEYLVITAQQYAQNDDLDCYFIGVQNFSNTCEEVPRTIFIYKDQTGQYFVYEYTDSNSGWQPKAYKYNGIIDLCKQNNIVISTVGWTNVSNTQLSSKLQQQQNWQSQQFNNAKNNSLDHLWQCFLICSNSSKSEIQKYQKGLYPIQTTKPVNYGTGSKVTLVQLFKQNNLQIFNLMDQIYDHVQNNRK
ncbi:Hypothetical_protein [Hexamita inflata]|uniref:Hypothetical_protein n=1 Tax=Hexamita inflata TaxID=28002 RepID=A0AA86PRS8_9EUKA|nr:Hypothetical protein HINF_LOCUS30657 [Hexamita inflata]